MGPVRSARPPASALRLCGGGRAAPGPAPGHRSCRRGGGGLSAPAPSAETQGDGQQAAARVRPTALPRRRPSARPCGGPGFPGRSCAGKGRVRSRPALPAPPREGRPPLERRRSLETPSPAGVLGWGGGLRRRISQKREFVFASLRLEGGVRSGACWLQAPVSRPHVQQAPAGERVAGHPAGSETTPLPVI